MEEQDTVEEVEELEPNRSLASRVNDGIVFGMAFIWFLLSELLIPLLFMTSPMPVYVLTGSFEWAVLWAFAVLTMVAGTNT